MFLRKLIGLFSVSKDKAPDAETSGETDITDITNARFDSDTHKIIFDWVSRMCQSDSKEEEYTVLKDIVDMYSESFSKELQSYITELLSNSCKEQSRDMLKILFKSSSENESTRTAAACLLMGMCNPKTANLIVRVTKEAVYEKDQSNLSKTNLLRLSYIVEELFRQGLCPKFTRKDIEDISLRAKGYSLHQIQEKREEQLAFKKKEEEALLRRKQKIEKENNLQEQYDRLIERGHDLVDSYDYADAVECFENALNMKPRSSDAWFGMGNCFHKMDSPRQAVDAWNKAISLGGKYNMMLWYAKANDEYRIGKVSEAKKSFEKVIELDNYKQGHIFPDMVEEAKVFISRCH